ncbi:Qat anti-phage system associated protein QatB [Xanthomonas nasturtii]
MGTSQSSGGPPASGPMIPPWADAPPAGGGDTPAPPPGTPPEPDAPSPQAQPQRWTGVRRNLGDFARNGDGRSLRRAVKHYVRSGYGGAATASRRMSSTGSTANALGNALAGLGAGGFAQTGTPLERSLLTGRSAEEVMDRVVDAVRPVDGTQDAEASRAAIRDALTDLLTQHQDADLMELSMDQREFAIERFVAYDVFQRFELDVGQHIQDNAPTVSEGLARLKEVKDYVRQTVSASFRKLRESGRGLTDANVSQAVREALRDTFEVFEGYME